MIATYNKWKQKSNFPTARGNTRKKKLFNLVFLVPYPKAIISDIYYQVICTLFYRVVLCFYKAEEFKEPCDQRDKR